MTFPNAQEQNGGNNVILVFDQGLQQILMIENDYQEDMFILMKAARIVSNDFF